MQQPYQLQLEKTTCLLVAATASIFFFSAHMRCAVTIIHYRSIFSIFGSFILVDNIFVFLYSFINERKLKSDTRKTRAIIIIDYFCTFDRFFLSLRKPFHLCTIHEGESIITVVIHICSAQISKRAHEIQKVKEVVLLYELHY